MIVEKATIIDIADKGLAVARAADGTILMTEGLIPGDVADLRVIRKRKGVRHAVAETIHTYSPHRQEPFCSHFGVCGGCKWQHMRYDAQLQYKFKTVTDAMTRIGKLEIPDTRPIIGAEDIRYYRNKLEYSFSNKRWLTEEEIAGTGEIGERNALGFHRPGAFDKVVDIHNCFLQEDLSDRVRNGLRTYALEKGYTFFDLREQHGLLRNLLVRNTSLGEWMVVVVFFEPRHKAIQDIMGWLKQEFPAITSLQYIINSKKNDTITDQEVHTFHGRDYIVDQLGEVRYRISAQSFFQTNSRQARVLYDVTAAFAGLQGHENVYDLYTGAGSIALYLAQYARQVVGIEEVAAAVEDARANAVLNGTENVVFYTGDVKDVLGADFALRHGKPDVVITDPPRAGMSDKVISLLLELEAPRIVYVSCNPATQARDLQLLGAKYDIPAIQPVDMFPHTSHIENVALLNLKS